MSKYSLAHSTVKSCAGYRALFALLAPPTGVWMHTRLAKRVHVAANLPHKSTPPSPTHAHAHTADVVVLILKDAGAALDNNSC